jgi:lipopolysaccharide/colanic/teichoic acid biosynthesis glycosyltransferase
MSDFIRRFIDIFVSTMSLIILSPFLVIIALIVCTTSSGGVFYRSQRVGRGGRIFTLYKFRSMIQNADKNGAFSVSNNDSRVTVVGQILRITKIDEIPQFFNVLIGDMTLVGPRPDIPQIMEQNPINVKEIILSVKPGLSDWSSLFRFDQYKLFALTDNPDKYLMCYVQPVKLALQEYYCRNRTLVIDMIICIYTALRMIGIKLTLPQDVLDVIKNVEQNLQSQNEIQ